MTVRLTNYLCQDGRTGLGQGYFNPIWADLDRRLDGLERLSVSWQAAVDALAAQGLARLDATVLPLIASAEAQIATLVETVAGLTDLVVAADLRHFEPAVAASLSYDAQGRVSALEETLGDASTRATAYAYDGGGNLTTATMTLGPTQWVTTYSYDGNGRVTGWAVVESAL